MPAPPLLPFAVQCLLGQFKWLPRAARCRYAFSLLTLLGGQSPLARGTCLHPVSSYPIAQRFTRAVLVKLMTGRVMGMFWDSLHIFLIKLPYLWGGVFSNAFSMWPVCLSFFLQTRRLSWTSTKQINSLWNRAKSSTMPWWTVIGSLWTLSRQRFQPCYSLVAEALTVWQTRQCAPDCYAAPGSCGSEGWPFVHPGLLLDVQEACGVACTTRVS